MQHHSLPKPYLAFRHLLHEIFGLQFFGAGSASVDGDADGRVGPVDLSVTMTLNIEKLLE